MDDAFRKLLAEQDMMRRHTDMLRGIHDQISPSLNALKSLSENSGMTRMIEDAKRQQDMMRSVLGPIEDLRRMGLLDSPGLVAARDAYLEFQKRFRLPEINEATRLFRQFEESGAASAMRHLHDQSAGIRQALQGIGAPWLDAQNALRSIGGFVELQRIGLSLSNVPSFDFDLTERLRLDLGDWRVAIDWPRDIFTDVAARTAFYESRGLDLRLTDFPAAAFEQGAALAGLNPAPPALLEFYRPAEEGDEDLEEAGFERTNDAHDRLQRFESQLRSFIDERMRAAFGENWIKHRVPGDMRRRWIDKKQKETESREREWPLIAYADFADYVPIITRKDNWEDVFKPVFGRAESVIESFQRLYPIRICTMHARLITQDDELYLYVETKRLLTAIGVLKVRLNLEKFVWSSREK
jgi:Swt1-like HEPN